MVFFMVWLLIEVKMRIDKVAKAPKINWASKAFLVKPHWPTSQAPPCIPMACPNIPIKGQSTTATSATPD